LPSDQTGVKPPPEAISADRAVAETLQAFDKKKTVLVVGTLMTHLQAFAHRLLPRSVVARIAASVSIKVLTSGRKTNESLNITSRA